jgi:CDP-diacylglycerol--glycerol-3-phosphate 3-phosphatidyltransferase
MSRFSDVQRVIALRLTEPVGRALAHTPLSPNALTLIGTGLSGGVAAVLATGNLWVGGFLVLVAGAFDMLDGALARVTGRVTRFGALLDSTLDRVSEALVLFGLLIWYAREQSLHHILLIYAVFVGSVLVSYVRARAEGLGLRCEVGLFARPERVVLLALGLIIGQVLVVLWILAVLANLTAAQRVVYIWQTTKTDTGRRDEG